MLSVKDAKISEVNEGYTLRYCSCVSPADIPGTIRVARSVIYMIVQAGEGAPNKISKIPDDSSARSSYFSSCLEILGNWMKQVYNRCDPIKIAVPYGVGCELSKDDWPVYERMIEWFASSMMADGVRLEITIYLKN